GLNFSPYNQTPP
ncbi:hypothetical protein Zm00014a_005226, partial [Zea mays]